MSSLYATLSLLIYIIHAQPFNISKWETTLINPSHSNHHINLLIYYPSTKNEYPVMVFNHGWEAENTWFTYIWQYLVPKGYIIALPGDYEHVYMNEEEFAAAQRYTLDWLHLSCNKNVSCPLYQMIGNKSIASGHSAGGGATILSIGNYNLNQTFQYEFDSAFTLSGCGGNDVTFSAHNISKPIFIMSATHDCVCPPDRDAIPYYNDVPTTTCKFLGDIINGTHCNFQIPGPIDDDICTAGEDLSCPFANHQDIPADTQHSIVNEYMDLFLYATLYQNDNSDDLQKVAAQLQSDKENGIMGDVAINCN